MLKIHVDKPRRVRLFRNGHNQAMRIPREYELPGDEAMMRREGRQLIIEPIQTEPLRTLLSAWVPLDEGMPEIQDYPPEETVL